MFDTELASCDLADRLDQLATELSVPLSTGGATQLAREAAAELRRSHAEVQRLRQQLRQQDASLHRIDDACRIAGELAQQIQADKRLASEGAARDCVRNMSVQRLPLSVRCQNVLAREGVQTVEQLKALSDRQLLGIVNMGQKSVFEIRQVLEALG